MFPFASEPFTPPFRGGEEEELSFSRRGTKVFLGGRIQAFTDDVCGPRRNGGPCLRRVGQGRTGGGGGKRGFVKPLAGTSGRARIPRIANTTWDESAVMSHRHPSRVT